MSDDIVIFPNAEYVKDIYNLISEYSDQNEFRVIDVMTACMSIIIKSAHKYNIPKSTLLYQISGMYELNDPETDVNSNNLNIMRIDF